MSGHPPVRPAPAAAPADKGGQTVRSLLGVFRYSGSALRLVWETSPALSLTLALLSLASGLLPTAIAYTGKLIIDGVVRAAQAAAAKEHVLWLLAAEAGLVALQVMGQRGVSTCQSLLRALLGQRVNVLILEKALTLTLTQFEDSDLYDKLTRARREASYRPLSLVMRTFGLAQNGVQLASAFALMLAFSPLAVLILVVAAVPGFVAEARFSGEAFRLFRWRTPETREQAYLETVVAREDYAKEVQLFELGRRFVDRYRRIFERVYGEDRDLTIRRGVWGAALGLVASAAFYAAFGWIALRAVEGAISLGDMTMYVLLFKQGQSALAAALSAVGGMYEDNLYLSNLYELLEVEVVADRGGETAGPDPGAGLRFDDVSFTYPGAEAPALQHVSFVLRPGDKLALVGENGSGKTTLIKLLARLYRPSSGRVTLDGLELERWQASALRRRIGIIFQDFVRYQLLVGENIGAGDEPHFEDEGRWRAAAEAGMSAPFIDSLPTGYRTQLGRWFKDGQELSVGQWQKIALSRAFMRQDADILVLDEPTASMDAEAEVTVFNRFRALTQERMAIVISHRFSTVRMADRILVLHQGRVIETGSHPELMAKDGVYARLFGLQAAGYR